MPDGQFIQQSQGQVISQGSGTVTIPRDGVPMIEYSHRAYDDLAITANFLRCGVPAVQIVVNDITDGGRSTDVMAQVEAYFGDNLAAFAINDECFTVKPIGSVGLLITRKIVSF